MFEQKIYHGSDTVNEDGTRFLIDFKKGEICVLPTSEPSWKNPSQITNRVKTRMITNKKRRAMNEMIRNYFGNRSS